MNYEDIILTPTKAIVKSRSECDITTVLGNHTFASPVCPSNMPAIVNPQICKIFDDNNWFYVYPRVGGAEDVGNFVFSANVDKLHKTSRNTKWNKISISIGITEEWLEFLKTLYNKTPYCYADLDYITIDVAHAHTDAVLPLVDFIKSKLPDTYVIVGNVATGQAIEFLENAGVDCAKVGIGVSQACRTRQFTGFGSTTVSSLIECKEAAKSIKVMADGGLTIRNGEVWIGDIAKAIRFGADFVMSGSLFSRCIDSPAIIDGYYGNSTARAKGHEHHIEGTTVNVQTNGLTIEKMMKLISDSLKSSVSYGGGKKLDDLKNVRYNIL